MGARSYGPFTPPPARGPVGTSFRVASDQALIPGREVDLVRVVEEGGADGKPLREMVLKCKIADDPPAGP
jgi:hypothetical protein